MTNQERRKFMRFDTSLNASYEARDGQTSGKTLVQNLSREGMRVFVDAPLQKGSDIDLHMNVPGDNVPLFACAKVAWNRQADGSQAKGFIAGVKFIKIDRYDKARLLDYVYTPWLKFVRKEA